MIDKTNNTSIIYFTRLHWIIFFWPILALCGALVVSFYLPNWREVDLALIGFSLIWVVVTWVTFYFSSLTIKKNHIIIRTGVIVRQIIDIPLNKIEAVDIRQSILGSILRYGMISITGTGGTCRVINYIDNPLTCRRYIEQLLGELGK
jgi:uncharacterized membrane protein YdbT with pleckstrin-like domain